MQHIMCKNKNRYVFQSAWSEEMDVIFVTISWDFVFKRKYWCLRFTDDSRFERLDPKGCRWPARKSHPFISYCITFHNGIKKCNVGLSSDICEWISFKLSMSVVSTECTLSCQFESEPLPSFRITRVLNLSVHLHAAFWEIRMKWAKAHW